MSFGNLFYFWRIRVRARLAHDALAAVGIATGVALLFAAQVSNLSLRNSMAELTHGLVGRAQLMVVGRDASGFDSTLVERIAKLPGVRVAAPVVQAPARIVGPSGARSVTLFAADDRVAALGGRLLHGWASGRLADLDAVMLPQPIATATGAQFGETITVQVAGRTSTPTVGPAVTAHDVGALAASPVAIAPLRTGQRLAGIRGFSRVYVVPDAGADVSAIREALVQLVAGRLDVRPADWDVTVFKQASGPNDQSTSLFAALAAAVGFLFALNAMLLSTRERRRVIADLSSAGLGLRAVAQVVLLDALVLGAISSIAGLVLGLWLSGNVYAPSPGYLTLAFPVGSERSIPSSAVTAAFGAGMLATILGAFLPVLAALRRPIDPLGGDHRLDPVVARTTSWDAALFGGSMTALAGALVILAAAPRVAPAGVAALGASMIMVLPVFLRGLIAGLDRARRLLPGSALVIALGELRSAGNRTVALASIAAIAVFGATAIEGAHGDLQRGLDADVRELNDVTDLWISPASTSNALATIPFAPGPVIATVARVPGVAAVHLHRGGFLDIGDRRVWLLAPPSEAPAPIPAGQIIDGSLPTATARIRAGGWVTASAGLAAALHARIGSTIAILTPTGPRHYRLAATTTNLGWTPGAMVFNASDFRDAWGIAVTAMQVQLAAGSPAAAAQRIRAALGPNAGFTIETVAQRDARNRETARHGLSRLTQIGWLLRIAAALAIVAAMGGMIWQRRARLADLKATGIEARQLRRALLIETGCVLLVGCVAGALYGLLGAQLLDRALTALTGFPVARSVVLGVAILSTAVVASLAWLMTVVPGALAVRVPTDTPLAD